VPGLRLWLRGLLRRINESCTLPSYVIYIPRLGSSLLAASVSVLQSGKKLLFFFVAIHEFVGC